MSNGGSNQPSRTEHTNSAKNRISAILDAIFRDLFESRKFDLDRAGGEGGGRRRRAGGTLPGSNDEISLPLTKLQLVRVRDSSSTLPLTSQFPRTWPPRHGEPSWHLIRRVSSLRNSQQPAKLKLKTPRLRKSEKDRLRRRTSRVETRSARARTRIQSLARRTSSPVTIMPGNL